jgi:hypothetical protein
MKPAADLLNEIVRHVQPPRGSAVALTEEPGLKDGEPNWIASIGVTDLDRLERFNNKVAELRKSDPVIEWDQVMEQQGGRRRVGKWFSELDRWD